MDNKEYIWRWLWERIGNDYGVAGLMGNIQAESGLRADNLQNSYEKSLGMTDEEYVKAVDDLQYSKDDFIADHAGFGLCQWTYWSRKRALYEFAEETGRSIGDLTMQLEFLWSELGPGYKHVLLTLLNAKSVREASDAVMLEYERPADQSEENRRRRAALGERLYDEFAGQRSGETMEDDKEVVPEEKAVSGRKLTIYKRYFYNADCYKQGNVQVPYGVQVHSTGANNPYLKRYVQPDDGRLGKNPNGNDHNHPGGNVCANAYVGKLQDGTVAVYEALPWEYRCWLSGSGDKGNANRMGFIGYEICEDGLNDKTYFDAAMDMAIRLTAYLCQAYGLSVNNVRDHSELHGMGLASNHGDITHWLKKFGLNMDWFRMRVKTEMEEPITVEYVDCDEVNVLYQATVDESGRLNVRSGPGKKYSTVFQAQPGSIVDVLDDSNAEWRRVQQDGKSGYAMSEYLHKVEPVPPEPPVPSEEYVKIPMDLAKQLYDVIGSQLVIDARSGNYTNIDYQ